MAKCVIADDSRIIRMLLSKIMANLNFEVIEAEDGEEVVVLESTITNASKDIANSLLNAK